MQVFLKQNGYEVLQVKPNTFVTLFANNVPYTYSAVTFRIYSYPPYAGPPTVVYEKTVNKNWQNEAWIGNPDEVLLNFAEGSYVLWAGSLEFDYVESATLNFEVTSSATDAGSTGVWTPILNIVTQDSYSYNGGAKLIPFTFSAPPEQFNSINQYLVDRYVDDLKTEAVNNGSMVLKLRLWRDTSPFWSTNYKGEIELSNPPGFNQPIWVVAILLSATIGLFIYFAIKPLIGEIKDLVYGVTGGITDIIYGPVDPDTGKRPETLAGLSMGTIIILAIIVVIILGQSRSKAGVKSNAKAG